ncbi:MAG: MFS transporter [Chloroflexi bacterium]|nr:MFS transporter [Chloroflexota bacterium]MBA3741070.1 MFS transporter [Chloroflexota bacterium]
MSLEAPRAGEPSPSEMAAAAPKRPSLWRHRDFVKLWSAQTISQFGDEVTGLALPLVAIITLGASPLEIGLLGTFQFLPFILLTIPAGVWVDRMRRKPILIGADIGRALLLTSIPVAFIGGWLSIPQLYFVGFMVGCLEVFFDIAYQSYLPAVIEREQLTEGNAKLELSSSASSVIGPGVAGFLVELVRAPFAILFDALSYLGAVVMLLIIRRPEVPPARHDAATGPRPSMRTEAIEGLRYVLGHRYLRSIAACTGTLNLFGNIGGVILLIYIINELGITAGTVGIIFAIANLGVLFGALTAERLARWIGIGPTIVWSAFISAFALVPVAIAPREAPVPFLVVSGVIGAATAVIYNVNQVSLRQAITPERMLGRMNATMRFVVWGTIPIGSIVGGFLGGLIGLQATIWVGAIGSFLGFLPVFFSQVRTLRRIPESS